MRPRGIASSGLPSQKDPEDLILEKVGDAPESRSFQQTLSPGNAWVPPSRGPHTQGDLILGYDAPPKATISGVSEGED
jgi:hypothetical protein